MRYTKRKLALLLSLIVYTAAPFSHLNAKPLAGIIGEDNRQLMPQNQEPWQAIGQINISGYRKTKRCTGTLIAPNKVLTAAHCLVNLRSQKPTHASRIHFLAGIHKGKYLAHAKAKCFFVHPEYKKSPNQALPPFNKDLAVIILRKNLSLTPILTTTQISPLKTKELVHASYSGDRRFALTAHKNCQRIQDYNGLWLTDCDTHFGSSGGPVLLPHQGQDYRLSAIMVGMIVKRFSIAVPIQSWLPFIQTAQCP